MNKINYDGVLVFYCFYHVSSHYVRIFGRSSPKGLHSVLNLIGVKTILYMGARVIYAHSLIYCNLKF